MLHNTPNSISRLRHVVMVSWIARKRNKAKYVVACMKMLRTSLKTPAVSNEELGSMSPALHIRSAACLSRIIKEALATLSPVHLSIATASTAPLFFVPQ